MTPTKTIADYTAATTIDGTTHYLLIQPGGAGTAYKKINRNTYLGVTGQPVDISTTQTISNKILGNSNLVTLLDGGFTLQNNVDTTKRALFSLASITTGQTRTYTLPDATSTLANLTSTQTLTNKTLTAPTITGGSIDQSTITVDSIAGHTTGTSGTIYGLGITLGKISGASISNGTVSSTALATNAVQGNQIATNAITIGYAQSTTNFASTSTTPVQITGLTTTVTIPAGGRRIKITARCGNVSASAVDNFTFSLWDGVVNTGTQLASSQAKLADNTFTSFITVEASLVPAAGSKTYNVGMTSTSATTTTFNASATNPMYILVEVI